MSDSRQNTNPTNRKGSPHSQDMYSPDAAAGESSSTQEQRPEGQRTNMMEADDSSGNWSNNEHDSSKAGTPDYDTTQQTRGKERKRKSKEPADPTLKHAKRKEQNRVAAHVSRNRKRLLTDELQHTVLAFTQANSVIRRKNEELESILQHAQTYISTHKLTTDDEYDRRSRYNASDTDDHRLNTNQDDPGKTPALHHHVEMKRDDERILPPPVSAIPPPQHNIPLLATLPPIGTTMDAMLNFQMAISSSMNSSVLQQGLGGGGGIDSLYTQPAPPQVAPQHPPPEAPSMHMQHPLDFPAVPTAAVLAAAATQMYSNQWMDPFTSMLQQPQAHVAPFLMPHQQIAMQQYILLQQQQRIIQQNELIIQAQQTQVTAGATGQPLVSDQQQKSGEQIQYQTQQKQDDITKRG
jgi:bZIP transcription factor